MRISIVGAGHVGTVCAAGLAAVGHEVSVLDIDEDRIERLRLGEAPFVEPNLLDLLERGRQRHTLSFHTSAADALADASLIFLCVNTPNSPDGSVDLSAVEASVRTIVACARADAVIVNRSTAPVGTAEYIRSLSEDLRGTPFRVAVNPEFLAEGTAVRDFLAPDRILVGALDPEATAALLEAYAPIIDRRLPPDVARAAKKPEAGPGRVPVVITDPASAELAKYAANSMLAVKISFINEIAGIAEELGADVTKVAEVVGLDSRIGPHFLRAGVGWGGSCFPKDIVALQGMAATRGLTARILRAAHEVNAEQRLWTLRHLQARFKTLFGRRVGLLGLSFKPNTDDVRDAPALEIASQLTQANVQVRAFDPVVRDLPYHAHLGIELAEDETALAKGADALILVTEWPRFASLDLGELRRVMRTPLMLDGRNFFDPETVRAAGLDYIGVGRNGQPHEHASRRDDADWPSDLVTAPART